MGRAAVFTIALLCLVGAMPAQASFRGGDGRVVLSAATCTPSCPTGPRYSH
jgi:hypothetical protein